MAGTVVDGEGMMTEVERDDLLAAMAMVLVALAEKEGVAPETATALRAFLKEWADRP